MDIKSRQIGWEIWWARYWATRFRHRPKIQTITDRYGISRQQANEHAKRFAAAMSVVLEPFGGDASKLFKEAVRKSSANEDGMVRIAEFDVETGEFTLGERCWKDRASSVVDVGEGDDTHLAHEVLRNAIVLAKRERDRLLQLNPTSAVERVNKNERLKVLAPLIQIVRKAGRPKNP